MMVRWVSAGIATAVIAAVAGCGNGTAGQEAASPSGAGDDDLSACLVSDVGGVDDQGFNQTTMAGVTRAAQEFGIRPEVLESNSEEEYATNLATFVDQGCGIIISVGYLLADATKEAANANPEVPFTIVDYTYPAGEISSNNVLGQVFRSDEASFLAGYLAAGMSQSGTVGTFGGMDLPTVTTFMDGFAAGVARYNADNGTAVAVVGWDPATRTGVFTGDFTNVDAGRAATQGLVDSGADIVMPVAGLAGAGAASLASEVGPGALKIIGVDSDQFLTDPDHRDVYLTSVLKKMDVTTYEAIAAVVDGSFEGGTEEGTLANGGVGLAPFHAFEDEVPAELVAALDELRAGIVAGTVRVDSSS